MKRIPQGRQMQQALSKRLQAGFAGNSLRHPEP